MHMYFSIDLDNEVEDVPLQIQLKVLKMERYAIAIFNLNIKRTNFFYFNVELSALNNYYQTNAYSINVSVSSHDWYMYLDPPIEEADELLMSWSVAKAAGLTLSISGSMERLTEVGGATTEGVESCMGGSSTEWVGLTDAAGELNWEEGGGGGGRDAR